jgi:hypothetical protein
LLGTVIASSPIEVPVTGVTAQGIVGTVTIGSGSVVQVTGNRATGIVGTVLVWGTVIDAQVPDWVEVIT